MSYFDYQLLGKPSDDPQSSTNPKTTMKLHRFLPFPLAAAIAIAAMLASPANAAPPVTSGLKLSLDASALTGLSNGDTVSTWTDMSGLGNNATAAATGSVATYQTGALNGKPVVRFNSNGNASFNFTRLTDIRTVFWVFKKPSISTFTFFLGDSASTDFDPGAPNIWRTDTTDLIEFGTTKLMGNVVNGNTTSLTSNYSLLSLRTTGNVRADRLSYDRNIAGRSWTGDMAEVLIYNRVLTTEEERLVGSYLADKWGLTTAYPPFTLGVSLTAPANGQAIPSGTPVIATADVFDPGAFTPPVTFHVTPTSPSGPTVQTTVTTSPYTVDLGALAAGTYEIYTTVANNADPVQTATSATRTFTVAPEIPTTTTLDSLATPSRTYGQSVTFTATVSPVPTGGTVQFYHGANYVGSAVAVNTSTGVATVSTTTLGAGTGVITAEYSGYQLYATSNAVSSIEQVVEKAPLTVTAQNMVRFPNTANPTFPYQITGFTNGQTLATSGVTGTPSLTTDAVLASPVGNYVITCALGSLAASNYSFTLVNGTLIVVVSPIPVTSGLKLALDASALIGLTHGATVTNWTDMSGNNNHATAASIVNVATYQTNALNGKPVVRFNPNGNAYFNFTSRISDIRTVFWVFKKPNTGFVFFLGDSASADFDPGDPFIWRTSTPDAIEFGTTKLMGNVVNGNTTSLTSNYSLLSLRTTGNVRADRLSYDRGNAGRSWTGDMAEVLIYNRALTTEEEVQVGSYLASKYGLTTNYGGFGTWASANGATGQTPQQDHDNDGVENGIEFFMGETGSSFTANPSLNATNTISWPASAAYQGTYEVQTSPDLATWTNVDPRPVPVAGILSYTLPTGAPSGKSFVRLLVTPTP